MPFLSFLAGSAPPMRIPPVAFALEGEPPGEPQHQRLSMASARQKPRAPGRTRKLSVGGALVRGHHVVPMTLDVAMGHHPPVRAGGPRPGEDHTRRRLRSVAGGQRPQGYPQETTHYGADHSSKHLPTPPREATSLAPHDGVSIHSDTLRSRVRIRRKLPRYHTVGRGGCIINPRRVFSRTHGSGPETGGVPEGERHGAAA
jgi:hypothetical protein